MSVSLAVAHATEYGPVSEANNRSSTQATSFSSDADVQQTPNEPGKFQENVSPNIRLMRTQFKKMLRISLVFLTCSLHKPASVVQLLNQLKTENSKYTLFNWMTPTSQCPLYKKNQ
jgi:hypothetical protein